MPLRVIGHRGYPARYPENTVASLLAALLAGADGVEFDVRLSRDGAVVLLHDPDTSRVTGGAATLAASGSSLPELRRVDLGMGQHVPTLDEVLQALPRGYEIFLEVKEAAAAEPSYWSVARAGRLDEVVFISFEPEALAAIRRLDSDARLGFNFETSSGFETLWRLHGELDLYLANPSLEVLAAAGLEALLGFLEKTKTLGMKASVWTVNSPQLLRGIDEILDYVITDDPWAWRQRPRLPAASPVLYPVAP